jgi:hypothetical protein
VARAAAYHVPVEISGRPKIFLTLALLVAFVAYVVIVDLGINAGRIHRGVKVADFNVGGLTPGEAEDALKARADQLKFALIEFERDDLVCRLTPLEVGWDPRPDDTAEAAREIGRDHNIWRSLIERARAWIFGAKVYWRASIDQRKMNRTINLCERRALAEDIAIDREKLRRKIKRAIVQWPRRTYRIPLQA